MGSMVSSLVFQPPSEPTPLPRGVEMLRLRCAPRAKGGSASAAASLGCDVTACFIAHPRAVATVLFSHGNAEDIGMLYPWLQAISAALGVNVMSYDYPGYGFSTTTNSSGGGGGGGGGGNPAAGGATAGGAAAGRFGIGGLRAMPAPTEAGCYASAEVALSYLVEARAISPAHVVLWGRSLGSAMCCHLASRHSSERRRWAAAPAGRRPPLPPFRGLVLQSPLLSTYRIAFPWRVSLPGDQFRNVDMARLVDGSPVLVVHGTEDCVVPCWHGQALLRRFAPEWRAPPLFVEGAGHNNVETVLEMRGRERGGQSLLFERVHSFIHQAHVY